MLPMITTRERVQLAHPDDPDIRAEGEGWTDTYEVVGDSPTIVTVRTLSQLEAVRAISAGEASMIEAAKLGVVDSGGVDLDRLPLRLIQGLGAWILTASIAPPDPTERP